MKKFKFNTQTSVIKGIEEKPVKKGFNWDRLIYFIVMLIITLSFGTYFINRYIKVTAESEIILDKYNVSFTDDIIVGEYYVEEGDSIGRGDSLFSYKFNLEDLDNDAGAISLRANQANNYSKELESWLTREQLNTLKNIDLKKLELKDVTRNINELSKSIEKTRKEVFLEIYPPSKLKSLQDKINSLKLKGEKLTEEIAFLKKYRNLTRQRIIDLKAPKPSLGEEATASISTGGASNQEFVFYSPKTGMVSQIYARSKEVCYRQNLVLDVIEFQGLHILAYFKQEDLKYVNTGDKVDIVFPDGSKSKGIIDKLYIKTTNLPDRLYETGSKVERRIKAVVVPLNVEDTEKWFEFYKINVKVSKPKFF